MHFYRLYMQDDFSESDRRGLYRAIHTRRDVRSRFIKKSIDNESLARILNAAHHAPSVGFSQPWDFILISDIETRKKIKKSFDNITEIASSKLDEPRRSKYSALKLEAIMDAPINICVTYNHERFGPFVIGRSSMPETGVYSVCCAVQNLWLAARAEGVGVGWVSILSADELRLALALPQKIVPVAYLCLGYVEEFAKRPDLESAGWLPRMALSDVIHYEQWGIRSKPSWSVIEKLVRSNLDYA